MADVASQNTSETVTLCVKTFMLSATKSPEVHVARVLHGVLRLWSRLASVLHWVLKSSGVVLLVFCFGS